ncbi:MAG: putative toxin-antitoxin system toxin component, PIN family [Bacteroidales bacterium]|jgi:putative PIN family toxin of toxin-antitoxin system|nr:putative toxin-antitoxin system toxin component, PIN family [Bacteroidales bacterium]
MRLVLDTNSLIQCVSRRSRYHDLWLSFIDGRNQLCVTTEILNEYVEILQRETTENFASIMLEVILNNPNTLFINIFYKFNLITADPDDNKFIDCAIAAQAKYIVTEDHHYDALRDLEFPKVDIIGLDEAMRMIS